MAIGSITEYRFNQFVRDRGPLHMIVAKEKAWFADSGSKLLGVVLQDNYDRDWNFVVLGRDEKGNFQALTVEASIDTEDEATRQVQQKMEELLESGDITD